MTIARNNVRYNQGYNRGLLSLDSAIGGLQRKGRWLACRRPFLLVSGDVMRSSLPILRCWFLSSACATVSPPPPPIVESSARRPTIVTQEPTPDLPRRPAAPHQVDPQFGVAVADPYRWLENDVRNDS